MRKVITILLAFVILLLSFALAEDPGLSENEQQFIGSWVMYMSSGSTTYLYTITFFDDQQVVLKTLSFDGSKLVSDHTSSGKWCGFSTDMIILTLAGHDFAGGIKEDGLFVLLDYKTKEPTAFFSRCPDLSDRMV